MNQLKNFKVPTDKSKKQLLKEISELKKANNNLEKFKTIYEYSPLPFQSLNEDGSFREVNPAWLNLLGYKESEVIGKYYRDFLHPDWQEHFDVNFPAFKKRGYVHNVSFKIKHKEGHYLDISFEGCIGYNPDGRFRQTYCVFTDITENLKLINDLEESEKTHSTLIDNQPGIVYRCKNDENWTMLFISENCKKITGYTTNQLISNKETAYNKLIHPDDRRRVRNSVSSALREKNHFEIEYRIITARGNEKWMWERGTSVRGSGDLLDGVIHDITARKLAEETNKDNARLLVQVGDIAKMGGWEMDLEKAGKATWTKGTYDIIEIEDSEPIPGANEHVDWYLPEYRQRIKKKMSDLIKTKQPMRFEAMVKTKKGNLKCCLVMGEVIEDNGKVVKLRGIIQDITDRKQAEEAILSEKEFSEKIIETSNAVIVGLDKNHLIRIFNKGVENITGYKKAEVIGKDWFDIFFPTEMSDEMNKVWKDAWGTLTHSYINQILTKKGEERIVSWQTTGMYEDKNIAKHLLISIGEDITDRKQAEAELNKAFLEIKQLKDKVQAENIILRKKTKPTALHKDFIGESAIIQDVVNRAMEVAKNDTTVLLYGETGTGKELLANGIHNASKRKDKILITINCAAIPDTLVESELFGSEKGSYTDSKSKKIGIFEIADKSTLFLDEIGELPLATQSKLLRVIENREITRVGGNKPIKVDVRLIAATNQKLESLIKEKQFRQDLYYRLNVYPIELPPLRIRVDDIPLLTEKFVKDFNNQMGKAIETITKKDIEKLKRYSWPGNARELRNIIERSMISSVGKKLIINIPDDIDDDPPKITNLEDLERNHILSTLERTYWKISGIGGAAEILGLHPNTLNARIKKLGIKRPK